MISKLITTLLTVALAKQTSLDLPAEEKAFTPTVKVSGSSLDWGLFSLGIILGSTVEAGTNLGAQDQKYWQCIGQSSDLIESGYFSYFFIRTFIEKRSIEYVTYVSVYISRFINSIHAGPCWSFGKKNLEPSEAEIEAETGLLAKLKRGRLGQAFNSDLTEEEQDKINSGANAIFDQLQKSLATVNAFLLIMEIVEILIDALSFTDTLEESKFIDAGIMAGKGVTNAGFTTYFLVMQYWKPNEKDKWQLDWEKEPEQPIIEVDVQVNIE